MTDNLDALRAKVVAADAQYLDYEDASLPQERAHYPAVDLIDAQAELITALEAALTASEQARAQAVAERNALMGYLAFAIDSVDECLENELPIKAAAAYLTNLKAPAPNADAEAGGA